jgi:hypothetical protein
LANEIGLRDGCEPVPPTDATHDLQAERLASFLSFLPTQGSVRLYFSAPFLPANRQKSSRNGLKGLETKARTPCTVLVLLFLTASGQLRQPLSKVQNLLKKWRPRGCKSGYRRTAAIPTLKIASLTGFDILNQST